MQVGVDDAYIYLKCPYHDRERAKRITGWDWNAPRKAWRYPKTLGIIQDLEQTFPELKWNPILKQTQHGILQAREKVLTIKAKEDTDGDPKLRPYQRVDVEFLAWLKRGGVFNQQRTGKTPTILKVLEKIEVNNSIIIVPASLQLNWQKEIREWLGVDPILYKGTPKKRRELPLEGIVVVSYDTFRADRERLIEAKWECVILDEGHRLRNRKTQQTEALFQLAKKDIPYRYVLTGTPTVKGGDDIYGILHFLFPKRFTSYWKFAERYFIITEGYGKEVGEYNPRTVQELKDTIAVVSTQRKREDVMRWLPAKQYSYPPLEMSPKQRKAYEQMEQQFFMELDEGEIVSTWSVISQMLRLRQICIDPSTLGADIPSVKTDFLLDFVEDGGTPLVVMSWFTSYLKTLQPILEKKGWKVGMLHGEMTAEQKHKAVQDFQGGLTDIILCNTQAAGVGFTLDRADTILFMDRMWNPADNEQAEDRIVPVTEERNHNVNVVIPVVQGTIEEWMMKQERDKKDITEVVNSCEKETLKKMLTLPW